MISVGARHVHGKPCCIPHRSMQWHAAQTSESILAVDHDLAMPADGHSECDRYTSPLLVMVTRLALL